MNILELLRTFPSLWATFGLLVGGGIMFWVAQKFGPIRNQAQGELIKSYQEQVKAASGLAEIQLNAHMVQLKMQKDHWTEELSKLEASRDEYKTQSHAARNEANAYALKIQELEMRPSVELIQTEQQAFYKEMVTLMKNISTKLNSHDESIPRRIQEFQKPILDACNDISKGMTELVTTLQNCGTLPKKAA
jgi:chromosome segregation ATPase